MNYSNKIYTIEDIEKCIKELIKKYSEIQEVILFGSYSRGEATSSSDIDILITKPQNIKPMIMWAFGGEIRESLKKPVDIFRMKSVDLESNFYDSIKKDGVIINGK